MLDGLEAWLGSSGDSVVVLEENGFQGSRSEVLCPASKASAGGLAVSVFWNVEGLVMFSAARRGKMVCSGELMDCEPEEFPRAVQRLARLAEDEEADLVAVGAAMVEQFSGVAFDRSVVDAAVHRSLTPVLEDYWTYGPDDTPLHSGAPQLVPLIVGADDETRRRLALWAAGVATVEAGISDERAVGSHSTTSSCPTPLSHPRLLARYWPVGTASAPSGALHMTATPLARLMGPWKNASWTASSRPLQPCGWRRTPIPSKLR